jgi:hypothetical protein
MPGLVSALDAPNVLEDHGAPSLQTQGRRLPIRCGFTGGADLTCSHTTPLFLVKPARAQHGDAQPAPPSTALQRHEPLPVRRGARAQDPLPERGRPARRRARLAQVVFDAWIGRCCDCILSTGSLPQPETTDALRSSGRNLTGCCRTPPLITKWFASS